MSKYKLTTTIVDNTGHRHKSMNIPVPDDCPTFSVALTALAATYKYSGDKNIKEIYISIKKNHQ